jgi:hypothetical protein
MPQTLKPTNDEFNPDELDVEWDDSTFDTYDGEQPPGGTALLANVKKMWWTYSSDDTAMIAVLMIAEGNNHGKEEYDGLPIWEYLVFKTSAAFKYGPFLEVTGITLKDIKTKMKVDDEDEKQGAPILAIGSFKPDTDDSVIGVITKRERYNGEWQTKAGKYLSADEIEDMEDDDEPEEKPRGRRSASKAKATPKGARSRSKPAEPDDDDDDDDVEEVEDRPARGSRSARGTRTTKPAAKPASRRGSRRSKGDDEDVPF